MELGLQGKGALVTGASKGIGKAVAWALAREGADVAICARRREELEKTAREIEDATGRTIVPIPADMGSPTDIDHYISEAGRRLGRIDILVNNAGAALPGYILDLPDEAFVDAVNVKLLGYVRCSRAVLPYLRQVGGGCIVLIAGNAARQPGVSMSATGLVNAGVVNFAKALSDAVAKDNIRVVAISPGSIQTDRSRLIHETTAREQGLTPAEVTRRITAGIPLGRSGEASDIADAVLFLVSDHARYITGAHITVDGGMARAAF